MKSRKSITKKVALVTASVFSFALVAAPATAFASTTAGQPNTDSSTKSQKDKKIPPQFTSEADCVTRLQQYPLAKIKDYGNKRIDVRVKELEKIEKQTKKLFVKADAKAEQAVQNANREAADTLAKSNADTTGVAEPTPPSSRDKILGEISDTRVKVKTAKVQLQGSDTQLEAAQATCDAIWDTRVFGYLKKKVNELIKVGTLNAANLVNSTRYKTTLKLAKKLDFDLKKLDKYGFNFVTSPEVHKPLINTLKVNLVDANITNYKSVFREWDSSSANYNFTRVIVKKDTNRINKSYAAVKKYQKQASKKAKGGKDSKTGGVSSPPGER